MSYLWCKTATYSRRPDTRAQTLSESTSKAQPPSTQGVAIWGNRRMHGPTTCSACRPMLSTMSLSSWTSQFTITYSLSPTRSSASKWWIGSLSTGTPTRSSGTSTEGSRSIPMELRFRTHQPGEWPHRYSRVWTSIRSKHFSWRRGWVHMPYLVSSQGLWLPICQVQEHRPTIRLTLMSATTSSKIPLNSSNRWSSP